MKDQEGRRDQLTKLETTYSSIINNPLMAVVIAVKDRLKFVNERALRISGYSRDEFTRMYNAGLKIIHPDDHPVILEARKKELTGSSDESLVVRIMNRNEGYTWIESYVRKIEYFGESAVMISFIDISKRVHYMNRLEESEEKFRKYFYEDTSVRILVDDNSLRIKEFNKAAIDFYGYSSEELENMPLERILWDKKKSYELFTRKVKKKGENFFLDYHRLSSGDFREVEVYVTFLKLEDRDFYLFTVKDATEKSHLLRKKEEFNRDLLLLSEAAKHLINLNEEDLIYDYMIDMIHQTHKGLILLCNIIDQEKNRIKVRSVTGVANKMFSTAMQIMGESPLKKEYQLSYRNMGISEPGKLRHFVGGFEGFTDGFMSKRIIKPLEKLLKIQDVYLLGLERNGMLYAEFQFFFTEGSDKKPRKHFIETLASLTSSILHRNALEKGLSQSETRFRNLVEQSIDGIIITDERGTVTHCNEALVKISGYAKKDILNGNLWEIRNMHFRPTDSSFNEKFTPERFTKAIKTGKAEWFYKKLEREFIHADHSPRILEITAFPFSSNTGRHLCVIARDISLQKINELKLQEQARTMKDLIRTRDKFFSIIAHDLKGPIGNSIGFARILKDEIHDRNYDRAYRIADTLENSSVKVLNLLNNLLEWSRLQTGKISCNPVHFDIAETLLDNIEILKETAKIKKIRLTGRYEKAVPVFADINMINTVVRNLLSNAIKFTRPGGEVRLEIKERVNTIQVSIIDNGVGIPGDSLDKLFRIDNSFSTRGTDNEAGTGLGLILCKDFIEKNGGMIDVQSKENVGTEFFFTLPAGEI